MFERAGAAQWARVLRVLAQCSFGILLGMNYLGPFTAYCTAGFHQRRAYLPEAARKGALAVTARAFGYGKYPSSLKEQWSGFPMMTWSSTSILMSWPARMRSRVTLMSASDGNRASPQSTSIQPAKVTCVWSRNHPKMTFRDTESHDCSGNRLPESLPEKSAFPR